MLGQKIYPEDVLEMIKKRDYHPILTDPDLRHASPSELRTHTDLYEALKESYRRVFEGKVAGIFTNLHTYADVRKAIEAEEKANEIDKDALVKKFGIAIASTFSANPHKRSEVKSSVKPGDKDADGNIYVGYFRIFVNPKEYSFINSIGEFKRAWNDNTLDEGNILAANDPDNRSEIISNHRVDSFNKGVHKKLAEKFGLEDYVDQIKLVTKFAAKPRPTKK